jgi:NhaA family Na+:H+ antiporter
MNENLGRLPKEPVDRLTRPLTQFLRVEALSGAVLLLFTAIAVAAANSPWSSTFLELWEIRVGIQIGPADFSRSLQHWITDALMTFLFFLVALELKRELVLGELRNPRTAALSLAAAVGGMVAPAGLYLLLVRSGPGARGWGTVMATDTAFVIGCLAVLGTRIPLSLRLFLLSLAIFDDIGAILVVAFGYGGQIDWFALSLAAGGLGAVVALARLGVRSVPFYFLIGSLVWLALDASGIHPTIAGVALGLLTPAGRWISGSRLRAILNRVRAFPFGAGGDSDSDSEDRRDLQRAGVAAREAMSPVERLELSLHPWVAFVVMPLFALANAGVSLTPADLDLRLAAAVFAGFAFGKPFGMFLFSVLAVRFGVAVRPPDLPWSLIAAGGLLTGIGFTMALFIAELAFAAGLLNSVKLAILAASIVSGASGLLALFWLTSRNPQGDSTSSDFDRLWSLDRMWSSVRTHWRPQRAAAAKRG